MKLLDYVARADIDLPEVLQATESVLLLVLQLLQQSLALELSWCGDDRGPYDVGVGPLSKSGLCADKGGQRVRDLITKRSL